MCNITVGRYDVPTDAERAAMEEAHPGVQWPADRWQGWVSPDVGNWTIFVGVDGKPVLCVDGEMAFAAA
jgi:hypothetical protein